MNCETIPFAVTAPLHRLAISKETGGPAPNPVSLSEVQGLLFELQRPEYKHLQELFVGGGVESPRRASTAAFDSAPNKQRVRPCYYRILVRAKKGSASTGSA